MIKYKMPFVDKHACSKEIKQIFCDGGSVWQKFAQTLSLASELIGEELADDLKTMCYQCPEHDHVYSVRIIKDAFGDKYDTKCMEIVGSGTISQVYKTTAKETGQLVAIKVMHPNVKKEISEACNCYKEAKLSILFPNVFVTICDMFFQNIKEQLEMNREFKNGKRYKKMMQPNLYGNYIAVIPEMIEVSKKCIIMSYEESTLAANVLSSDIDKHLIMKMCISINCIIAANIISGFVHLDLHAGNYGIQNPKSLTDMRIVIYDFGQMADVTNVNKQVRFKLAISAMIKNKNDYVSSALGALEAKIFLKTIDPNACFEDVIRKLIRHIIHNKNKIDVGISQILTTQGKAKYKSVLIKEVMKRDMMEQYNFDVIMQSGLTQYLKTHYPYDELNELHLCSFKTPTLCEAIGQL